MLIVQPLCFEQIRNEQVDLVNVLAELLLFITFRHEFQSQFGFGDRCPQFVAYGHQELALCFKHRLQRIGHVIDTLRQFTQFVLTVALNPIAEVAFFNPLCPFLEHPHRVQQSIDHEIIQEKYDGSESRSHINDKEVDVAFIQRALIEIEVIAASIHPNDVLVVNRANFGVGGEISVEVGCIDIETVVRIRAPPHDRVADIDSPIELLGKAHGITQVRRRANVFDDGFHIPHVKIRNRFNSDFGLVECSK